MPWKACSVMEERLRFVARLLDGESMTDVCREFGISRKTGYKLLNRYREEGAGAITDRSRPVRYANQLPPQVEALVVRAKRDKPHWGARKIRELLVRRLPGDIRVPATSTIHAVLDRHSLVSRLGRRRNRAQGTPLSPGRQPNDLWCADFKGEFKLGNGRYCYPLTPPVSCFSAKPWTPPAKNPPSPHFSACSPNADCQMPSAPTTVCPSPAPMPYSISPNCRSGGCGSAFRSSASSRVSRSKTAATSACI
jgi:transposase